MAKITRKSAIVFGGTAGFQQIAEFGSLAAASPTFSTDPAVIQSLSNWAEGWFAAVLGGNSPAIEDMNAYCYVMAYQIAYLMQQGIPEWDSGTTYYKGSLVQDGNGILYASLTDSNLNNVVTDTSNWSLGSDQTSSLDLKNHGIAASVATNALTVAIKNKYGSDASASSPIYISFRNSTSATGTPVSEKLTAAASVVVPSGATLGLASGSIPQYIYVYAIDNAGTIELAVSGLGTFDEGSVQSSTTISAGATSANLLYSTTGRSNKAIRLIGRLSATEATAGTWATAPSEISLPPFYSNNGSQIYVTGLSARGSAASNSCLTWPTTTINTGADITYARDTTNGDTFTINSPGNYSVDACSDGGVVVIGITVNSADLTASPNGGLTYAQGLRGCLTESGAYGRVLKLSAGDILRVQTDTGALGGGADVSFCNIIKLTS